MGMYTEAVISINLKAVFRAAKLYGLPKPRYVEEWAAQLNLADVKKYCDLARNLRYSLHNKSLTASSQTVELFSVTDVLEAQALHYLYEGIAEQAGLDPKAGLKLLRKRSKAFRVTFV